HAAQDPAGPGDNAPAGHDRAGGCRPRQGRRRAHAGDLGGPFMDRVAGSPAGQPVVIGAGLAGLMTALYLSPLPGLVLAKAPLGSGAASAWAQGGIAVAVGADDEPALHAADTLAAGAGLCDPVTVERITRAAPGAIDDLTRWGVAFDRDADGRLLLG